MRKSNRDDFLAPVIKKLQLRVASRCSNPDCDVPTSGPGAGNDGINNIGTAAHICAAAPGGKRYSLTMTPKERSSIDNAIWLCSSCSRKIDNDDIHYTVELLHQWKQQAEQKAKLAIGKRPPNKNDAIDTLATALTGHPKRYIADAVANIHKATEKTLEQLDRRFAVRSSMHAGAQKLDIQAREPVRLKMKIDKSYIEEYMAKYSKLIDQGEDLCINSNAISFEGSALLDELFGGAQEGIFRFSTKKISAISRLSTVSGATGAVSFFYDFTGEVSAGAKSFAFNGKACNGMIDLRLGKRLGEGAGDFGISIDLEKWEGLDIKNLPYFDSLLGLFKNLAHGWGLCAVMEIDGLVAMKSDVIDLSKDDFSLNIYGFLKYVEKARVIAKFLNADIKFTPHFSFSSDDYLNVERLASICEGKSIYSRSDLSSNVSTEIVLSGEMNKADLILALRDSRNFSFVQQESTEGLLLGTAITIPAIKMSIAGGAPRILGESRMDNVDLIHVEWVPEDDFVCALSFV